MTSDTDRKKSGAYPKCPMYRSRLSKCYCWVKYGSGKGRLGHEVAYLFRCPVLRGPSTRSKLFSTSTTIRKTRFLVYYGYVPRSGTPHQALHHDFESLKIFFPISESSANTISQEPLTEANKTPIDNWPQLETLKLKLLSLRLYLSSFYSTVY